MEFTLEVSSSWIKLLTVVIMFYKPKKKKKKTGPREQDSLRGRLPVFTQSQ